MPLISITKNRMPLRNRMPLKNLLVLQMRCHQLLLHNKDLLEHINRLALENKQLREKNLHLRDRLNQSDGVCAPADINHTGVSLQTDNEQNNTQVRLLLCTFNIPMFGKVTVITNKVSFSNLIFLILLLHSPHFENH